MGKTVFSVKILRDVLERVRDAVYHLQGPPVGLTMVGITERALQRGVRRVERECDGPVPPRPDGEQAGHQGRRSGVKSPGARRVHSCTIDPGLSEAVKDAGYYLRQQDESFEFAGWVESLLKAELRALRRKHGPIPKRPSRAALRPGRRVQ